MTRHAWTASMSPMQRRRFLKMLGVALAAPGVPLGVRYAAHELAVGEAQANDLLAPTVNYIEINLRDQWDFGHVFVPPGIATYGPNLRRGENGKACALYYEPNQLQLRGNNFYLTPGSMALEPHLDTIAVFETTELSEGKIHGHEAANALRSPGRGYNSGPGRFSMYELDPRGAPGGNENHYTSTPTPVCIHNHHIKQKYADARNAVALKMLGRNKHTVYHCAAGLTGGEPDRYQTKDALLQAFDVLEPEDVNIVPTAEEAEAVSRLLKRVDARFFERYGYTETPRMTHTEELSTIERLLYAGEPVPFSLALTADEEAYWREGVPTQVSSRPKANIWEQVGWCYKLISSGTLRSVATEFVYEDVHDRRPESMMDVMMKQTVLPLVRLIERLKESDLYDNTLIAIYSTDGGRAPSAGSSGDEGKNTVIFAGGMIQGGYFGDVRVDRDDGNGHIYSYHAPDLSSGAPINDGAVGRERGKRIDAKHLWRTQMKAMGIPDALATSYPDVAGAEVLDFMLRNG